MVDATARMTTAPRDGRRFKAFCKGAETDYYSIRWSASLNAWERLDESQNEWVDLGDLVPDWWIDV